MIYLAFAAGVVAFTLVAWLVGRLTIMNVLILALTAAGTAPPGFLALRDDYPSASQMDEVQREMERAAKANDFYVADS